MLIDGTGGFDFPPQPLSKATMATAITTFRIDAVCPFSSRARC
jgi:hypothetical protein